MIIVAGSTSLVAASLVVFGWLAFRNLFADYQDSPAAAYVLIAGAEWLVALLFAYAALRLLRHAHR